MRELLSIMDETILSTFRYFWMKALRMCPTVRRLHSFVKFKFYFIYQFSLYLLYCGSPSLSAFSGKSRDTDGVDGRLP